MTKQKQQPARPTLLTNAETPYEAKVAELVLNAMTMRQEWIRRLSDQRRDIDEECRYPINISPQHYRRTYNRFGIAKRVVAIEPAESWQLKMEVYDSEESDNTPFEESYNKLEERFRLSSYMKKIDTISGIGRYGVMLIGLNDGKPLSSPVQGMPKSGVLEEGYKVRRPETKVLFIRVFDESMAKVVQWDSDPQSPRFGQPVYYQLQLLSPDDLSDDLTATQPPMANGQNLKVHWTRIVHVARNKTSSEVIGTPEMEDVFNHLLDLRKICGAGAEGYWQGAFPGLSFETQKDLENFDLDVAGLKKEARKYFEGMQRYIATVGMNVKTLSPNVQDPAAQFETAIKAICIAKGIPYRIFMGTEEAVLAGAEDKDSWKGRMASRREDYLTPEVVRPIVDRLIMYGVLPVPLEGKYMVHWPDFHEPTELDQAQTAVQITTALKAYVEAGIDELISPEDFLIQVMKFDPEVVQTILDNAVQRMTDVNSGEDVVLGGPSPEEIKQQAQQELLMKQQGRMNGKSTNGKPKNGKPATFNSNGKGGHGAKRVKASK